MSFLETLAQYVGRDIEVFQTAQLLTGRLLSVGNGSFTVLVVSNSYSVPSTEVQVFVPSVEYVRILAA